MVKRTECQPGRIGLNWQPGRPGVIGLYWQTGTFERREREDPLWRVLFITI
jgi:hypothetical protein